MTGATTELGQLALGQRSDGPLSLTARWVIHDSPQGRRLIEHGEVVITDGQIAFVGRDYPGEVARRVDLGMSLISPGLIDLDALSDLDTTILGIDHQPGWAKGRVWPRSYVERGPYEMYSPEELAFQKRFAFAQLLQSGITTAAPIASLFYREWGETVAEFDAAVDAAADLGLRVYLSPGYRAGGMVLEAPGEINSVFDEARGLQGLEDAVGFIRRHDGSHGGLVRGLLAPDRVETCTEELLRKTFAAAEELDCPVRLHMAQGQMELDTVRALHGCTAPQWLAKLGLLGPRLVAPHATCATADDLALYARNGVSIVHCPLVSGRHGAVLNSFGELRDMGINIAMGTDTAPPDMLLNLLVGLIGAHVKGPQHQTPTRDLWDAATIGGGDALGRPDLGRLQVGGPADIAVFALDDAIMTPAIDPITTLVAGGSAKVTRAVFVDGRLSMRRIAGQAEVAGLDLHKAQARAQAQFDALVAKYPERSWQHPPLSDLFPPSYPLESS